MLSSLLDEFAGKIDLIYIDPPFATGADFSYRTQVGDADVTKLPSMMEEVAYRDAWKHGIASYIQMLYERLLLISALLTQNGSIYIHIGPEYSDPIGTLCDELFVDAAKAAAITWKRAYPYPGNQSWTNVTDVIIHRAMGRFTYHHTYADYAPDYVAKTYPYFEKDTGRRYGLSPMGARRQGGYEYELLGVTRPWRFKQDKAMHMLQAGLIIQKSPGSLPQYKRYLDEMQGRLVGDLWDDIPYGTIGMNERTGYDTQKPEKLLSRIIKASSNEGDLVLDCFVGSGTTAAVAEKLGRRWIGVDIGRFAIQTTRKRLLDIPGCRPFEVQNLGKYERKYWQVARTADDARAGGVTLTFDSSPIKGEGDMVADDEGGSGDAVEGYVRFILDLYKSQPMLGQFSYLHGIREGRAVHIGATDSPVSSTELQATVAECAANGFRALDVLGWEWEMGLNPALKDELSRTFGVDIRLLYIPREILDQRNIDAGDVNFFELSVANVDVSSPYPGAVEVALTGFIPAVDEYMQARLTDMPTEWSDWIDYWSVDFEYDGEVFVNQWQSYRTRRERDLSLVSDPHEYEHRGLKRIVVKVIDIFGNDATVGLDFDAGN